MSSILRPEDLVGEELAAVSFVRDYVEFWFDGPILRALTNPSVTIGGRTFAYPEPESFEKLAKQVGARVEELVIEDGISCRFRLSNGSQVSIPLVDPSLSEAMHFAIPGTHLTLQVWTIP